MRVAAALATALALVASASATVSCSTSHRPCTEGACCDSKQVCTVAHWLPDNPSICLDAPPKCYASQHRCAGAPGKKYVPYANCCDASETCVEAAWLGYGRWCLPMGPKYYTAGERCEGAEGLTYVPPAELGCEPGFSCKVDASRGAGKWCLPDGGATTSPFTITPVTTKAGCKRRRRRL